MNFSSTIISGIDKLPAISRRNPDSTYSSNWLKLKRSTIRYVRRGSVDAKHTVILMPDPPNTIEHLSELIHILESDFQVVIFEGVGFGYSKASLSYDFSLKHNAEAIIEMLELLDIKNAILALTCVSALPGLFVANKRPDIVHGLVLGQAPSVKEAKAWGQRVDFKGVLGTPILGQLMLRMLRGRISGLWYKNALPEFVDTSPYILRTLDSFKRGARFSMASALQALKRDNTPANEFSANQPTIIVWGNLDRTHRKTNKKDLLSLLPNCKLIELNECGHFPDIEAPNEFAKAIHEVSESV